MRAHGILRLGGGLALCALTLLCGCRSVNSRKLAYLHSGERYAQDGKVREAAIQFSNAVRLDPNFVQAHYALSQAYRQTGANELAIYELSQVLQLQPENEQARMDVGQLLLQTGQFDAAAVQARWIVYKEPGNAAAQALVSAAAQAAGDVATALRAIRSAIALDPQRSEYHGTLGMLLAPYSKAQGESVAELQTAIRLDAANVSARAALAVLLQGRGDLHGAEDQMQSAVRLAPKSVPAREGLAALYLRSGDSQRAADVINRAMDDLADDPAAAPLLAQYLRQTGQMDRAPQAYEAVVKRHPNSLALQLAYARVLVDRGGYDTARALIADLVQHHGGDPGVILLQAFLLMHDGDTNGAVNLLQATAKSEPDDAGLATLLGTAQQRAGSLQEAGDSFGRALQLDAGNLDAQRGLADLAFEKGDASGLRESARQMLLRHPELADGYVWRGVANLQEHQNVAAVADLQEALKRDPTNSLALVQLGLAQQGSGNNAKARDLFEQALRAGPDTAAVAALTQMDVQAHRAPAAVVRIEAQLKREPSSSVASVLYDQLAQAQLAGGDAAAAAASAGRALQLDPTNRGAMQTFTQVQLSAGKLDPAIALWQSWAERHPGDPQAPATLGLLYQSAGDDAAATNFYRKALAIQPVQPEVSASLSALMAEHGGNLDVALSMAQAAFRARPTSASVADALGWIYFLKGLPASAMQPLQTAAALDAGDASAQYHLGIVLARSGNSVDARKHLQRAAELASGFDLGARANTELAKLGEGNV